MKQTSNGIDLHHENHGDQHNERLPWLVFSHSRACHFAIGLPRLPRFATDYRGLAIDARERGASEVLPGPYTFERSTLPYFTHRETRALSAFLDSSERRQR